MKPRHACAAAVLSWLLIMPPQILPSPSSDPFPVDVRINAPLSQWTVLKSFDKAEECGKARTSLMMDLRNGNFPLDPPEHMSKANIEVSRQNLSFAASMAQCISSGDPALKAK